MSTSLLSVDHLKISFGSVSAVRDLSFLLNAGEVLGLVGESGSGKSVTALAILRLLPLQAGVGGQIGFSGEELLSAPEEKMRSLRGRDITMIECRVVLTAAKSPSTSSPAA